MSKPNKINIREPLETVPDERNPASIRVKHYCTNKRDYSILIPNPWIDPDGCPKMGYGRSIIMATRKSRGFR